VCEFIFPTAQISNFQNRVVNVEQTTLSYYLESIFYGGVMDGKRTNFDLRRRNLDDDYSPDTLSASPTESQEARTANDNTRDGYDQSFLAERGLLSSLHPN
jgi:hypothetical protein